MKPAHVRILWIALWIVWIDCRVIHRLRVFMGGRPSVARDKIEGVSAQELPAVPAAELPADLTDSVLLDVREDDEWFHGHAPDAVHIPMSEVPSRMGEIDPEAQLYVVCGVGARSARVVQYLMQTGYDAVNVDGGMHAWVAAGRPLVRDDGAEARIV